MTPRGACFCDDVVLSYQRGTRRRKCILLAKAFMFGIVAIQPAILNMTLHDSTRSTLLRRSGLIPERLLRRKCILLANSSKLRIAAIQHQYLTLKLSKSTLPIYCQYTGFAYHRQTFLLLKIERIIPHQGDATDEGNQST